METLLHTLDSMENSMENKLPMMYFSNRTSDVGLISLRQAYPRIVFLKAIKRLIQSAFLIAASEYGFPANKERW